MALLTGNFFAETLGTSTAVTVLMPDSAQPPPVLYLLHGLGDDETSWTRNTALERYAAAYDLAVVMPRGGRSFYVGEHGRFLTEELPRVVARWLRVADQPAYVAGLSMGGYGALHWALHHPHRFAGAASLSGVLDVAHPVVRQMLHDGVPHAFPAGDLTGSDYDLLSLLERPGAAVPPLYLDCGTEDMTYPSNVRFAERARRAGRQPTVEFGAGDHDWQYWDRAIQRVLSWIAGLRRGR
ncbi:alpha/beta hydrolase family protein [Actinoplanes sp. NPDC024001]|uniref:alpha/beta hydrolase n=1 Tax=Actinoplanes sp. NPDC024001 TaxID=3154598 RepID=UPI0033E5EF06